MSVCLSVCSAQYAQEHSIFIILAQIFKQSVSNKSASTQRAIREHSEPQNKSHTSGSLKYCVLLYNKVSSFSILP